MVLIETVDQKNKNPRLRDLAAKNSRFRDWDKNFRDPEFSGYHSPPLIWVSSNDNLFQSNFSAWSNCEAILGKTPDWPI